MKTILFTGGAGFVGSNLAIRFKKEFGKSARVISFDNLKRRGSELNLERLKKAGVEFLHGDIRNARDLEAAGEPDVIIECAAEPSVLAGYSDSPHHVVETNLFGTVNCLERARRTKAAFVFLSTSRVYPMAVINGLSYQETPTRFELSEMQKTPGVSGRGFSEAFPLDGLRSLYGATKLASELLLTEYMNMYGFRGVINRCGVIAGPWQMGKIDQGIMALWVASHTFGRPLNTIGFGGKGKQVRDFLHIDDLGDLLLKQLSHLDRHTGQIYNVGGGLANSLSLQELTSLCRDATGKSIKIGSVAKERPADIRFYVTDNAKIEKATGWSPQRSGRAMVEETARWIKDNAAVLEPVFSA